jgi:tetratricopeptide (TPR) repeat protein
VNQVNSLVLSGDGNRLYSGSLDRTIKVWGLEAGKEALTLHGHTDGVLSLALSGDGKRLFSGSGDQTIKVWYLGAGTETGEETTTPVMPVASTPQLSWNAGLDLLRKKELAAYKQLCAEALRRLGKTTDPAAAERVARLALLMPNALAKEQLAEILQLARKAVAASPRSWSYLETLGAAHYRAGDANAAVQRLEEAIKEKADDGTVWMQLFLAMAYHHLGEPEEAKAWLARAAQQMKCATPSAAEGVWWGLLRQEAEHELQQPPRRNKKQPD